MSVRTEDQPPRYAPYDGSATPFTIGLRTLDPHEWIEPDADLERHLAEKRTLLADRFDTVFRQTERSRAAQDELLSLLVAHLTERHPAIWQKDGTIVRIGGERVDIADESLPPLARAGLLVSDDLVILQREEDGWRLSAGHLSFPSSWSLAEKFDRPMDAIHANVPGFAAGSRNAVLINRMFDNLQPERPVWRLNWSLYPNGELHRPKSKTERSAWPEDVDAGTVHIRVERQTLRRLPRTGALVFTIRIYSDPLAAIARHKLAMTNLSGLADQLAALDEAKIAYKGIETIRPGLIEWLREAAGNR
ncbi:heme-dependent oxidative N-demethylase family protein [Jiella pelagia]|uniref:DUF3445 domain-containing protein n=1 Tax=Jiella pelagia TaxID=2986949 RepID=A0ABY7BWU0_9HYPH|nr:DUF3445 domain-containing protein [Jiella pelagia]WAP68317.1 DUF3445 domain-containing protein [Jiella pelagia]